jgi:hypothetical protein
MKQRTLTMPEIMLIAGTRIALGVGIGLLMYKLGTLRPETKESD